MQMTCKYVNLEELNSIHWNVTGDDIAKMQHIHNLSCSTYTTFEKENNNVARCN